MSFVHGGQPPFSMSGKLGICHSLARHVDSCDCLEDAIRLDQTPTPLTFSKVTRQEQGMHLDLLIACASTAQA